MKVTFVIGVAGAGKSTFIKNNFDKDTAIINLYNYQKNMLLTFKNLQKSYEDCMEDLKKACKEGKDVVLEHTLLKKMRRLPYIQAVREVTDAPIDIVVLNPSAETVKERRAKRGINDTIENIRQDIEILEFPDADEGYNSITYIED